MGTAIKKIITFLVLIFTTSISTAVASPENDRVYQLESLAWLKSSDNLDDIFSEFLEQEYTKYFESQSRFVVKKISGISDILKQSELPYSTLIEKPEVLKKIAQRFKVESLIRTHVYKEAESYRFLLEWVYAPRGDVLSQFEFRFMDPKKDTGLRDSELPSAIQNALDQLILKLPFIAQVTGVEGDTITVNLGRNQNVHRKEIFTIYTLQGVKRHPKLNSIEEWRWQPVGRAQVDQVEDSISFAKVIETEPGQKVIRLQKIKEVLPAPPEPKKITESKEEEKDIPRLGWVAGNLGLAFYSREVGTGSGSSGRGGSGMGQSLDVEGLLWINSRWLGQLSLGGALLKYSPVNLATDSETGTNYSGTGSQVRIALGYALFPAKTIFDTIGWVHMGYRSTSYTLPSLSTDFTGSSSFGSLFLGVGGEVPFKDILTIQLGLDLGLLKSADNVFPEYGDPASTTDLMFQFGAAYHLNERLNVRLMFKISSQSMDFTNGESISQKVLSVGPSVLYYF